MARELFSAESRTQLVPEGLPPQCGRSSWHFGTARTSCVRGSVFAPPPEDVQRTTHDACPPDRVSEAAFVHWRSIDPPAQS